MRRKKKSSAMSQPGGLELTRRNEKKSVASWAICLECIGVKMEQTRSRVQREGGGMDRQTDRQTDDKTV